MFDTHFLIRPVLLLFLIAGNLSAPNAQTARPAARMKPNNARAVETVDYIINNGTVVTMDETRRVIERGAVAVRGERIAAVGTQDFIRERYAARSVVNARGGFILPGLINGHTHIPMTLFRGIADDLDLNEWLTKYIFPAEAQNVTEEFVRAGTQLGLAEMIRGGTTTYCDMYYFESAVAEETERAGVRGVLGETVIDFPVADNKTNAAALAYSERFIQRWQGNSLITPAIAPHAPYTVSREHLIAIHALAERLRAPVVIHVAETRKELTDMQNQTGKSPVEYLADIGFLNDRVIAAHVVYPADGGIEILKRYGVGVVHNPQSNMKLASGVAPVPQMLSADLALGLGTDGAASNNDLDLWEEMDAAAKLHKVFSGDPRVVTAEQALELATIRGARALHLEKEIGSLEAGKRADVIIVRADALNQTPTFNVYSALVYATKAADVQSVMINGKWVMRNRRLLTLNEPIIRRAAIKYRNQISLRLRETGK